MKTLISLLKAISQNKTDLNIEPISDELILYSIDCGMASLLKYHSSNSQSKNNTLLNTADLTAKIITQTQLQALDELILIASPKVENITLLKGMCLCQNYYPKPHFRIMADIDILVSSADADIIKTILLDQGYKQKSSLPESFYETHHHSMPFYNKKNNVWIEVHTHLFSNFHPVLSDELFQIDNIFKNTISMHKDKYSENVKQLETEQQFIYTCCHWSDELTINKLAIQISDMIQLIKNNGEKFDWNKVFKRIDNTATASYIYLIMSFFDKNKIINLPDNYASSFSLKNKNMGYINRLLLHKTISLILAGKAYNNRILTDNNLETIWSTLLRPSSSVINLLSIPKYILFPPKQSGRFKFRFQLIRIKKLLLSSNNKNDRH